MYFFMECELKFRDFGIEISNSNWFQPRNRNMHPPWQWGWKAPFPVDPRWVFWSGRYHPQPKIPGFVGIFGGRPSLPLNRVFFCTFHKGPVGTPGGIFFCPALLFLLVHLARRCLQKYSVMPLAGVWAPNHFFFLSKYVFSYQNTFFLTKWCFFTFLDHFEIFFEKSKIFDFFHFFEIFRFFLFFEIFSFFQKSGIFRPTPNFKQP